MFLLESLDTSVFTHLLTSEKPLYPVLLSSYAEFPNEQHYNLCIMPFNLPEVPAEYLQQGPAQSIFIALVIILILRSVYHVISAYSRNDFNKYPLINGISWWDPFGTSKKKRFVADSKALLVEGFSKVGPVIMIVTCVTSK